MGEVAGGLLAGHGWHVVADRDPLVEGGQHAEFDVAPQGGLPDQETGQRAGRVHVVIREHPHGFELFVIKQICRRTRERGPGKISVKQAHATVRR
ncbi:hypothetical protein ABT255_60935 [Streptomyces mirabilis]|uniref:hypothetical protein n=1 Tax=Streptomyces mirabilis TaxID=68239 RepID=UPI00332F0B77